LVVTDFSKQLLGSIFKDQAVKSAGLLDPHRCDQQVFSKLLEVTSNPGCVTSQKSEDIYTGSTEFYHA